MLSQIEVYVKHYNKRYPKHMAITYAIITQILNAAMYYCITLLKKEHSSLQILNIRMIFGVILCLIQCHLQNTSLIIQSKSGLHLILLRGLLGVTSYYCIFTCFSMIKISDGSVLVNTSPIWSIFFSSFFLSEKLSLKTIGFCLVSFTGIIFVSRPSFLFSNELVDKLVDTQKQFLGTTLGIAGSIFAALASITLRKISILYKGNGNINMLYNYFISAIVSSIVLFYIAPSQNTGQISFKFVFIAIILSICGYVAQLLNTLAFDLQKASIISPLSYFQVVFSFLIEIFINHITILTTSVFGAFLIVFGCIGVLS